MKQPMSERSRIAHVVRFVRECQRNDCALLRGASAPWCFLYIFSKAVKRKGVLWPKRLFLAGSPLVLN